MENENQVAIDIKEYFDGPIKAWGIVQNWKGEVVSRFDVEMVIINMYGLDGNVIPTNEWIEHNVR